MNVGTKIKEARTALGITQEQAAEELLVSRQTISSWENGKSLPDIVSVIKMSELYQLSLDELLKGDKELMKKIEKDTKLAKVQKHYIIFAWCAILFYVLVLLLELFFEGHPVVDFLSGLTPGLLLGITFAYSMASFSALTAKE